jgi:hypothetical protein
MNGSQELKIYKSPIFWIWFANLRIIEFIMGEDSDEFKAKFRGSNRN